MAKTRNLFPVLLLVLAAGAAAAVQPSTLLGDGSEDHLWLARLQAAPPEVKESPLQTSLFERDSGDSHWRRLGYVSSPIIAVGHRGTQLVTLLENGNWRLLAGDGSDIDGPVPSGAARLVALSGAGDALWGIAYSPAASPATAPATATAPSTSPSAVPPGVWLVELVVGQWLPRAPLPDSSPGQGLWPLHLAVINRVPHVALLDGNRSIRLLRLEGNALREVRAFHFDSPLSSYRLLSGTATPMLWAASDGHPDLLEIVLNDATSREVALGSAPASARDRTVLYGLGRIRVCWAAAGVIQEQDYNADGSAVGSPVTITLPPAAPYAEVARWVQYVIWAALLFAILSAVRLRKVMAEMVFDLEAIHLAPLGRRLAAGCIDLLPMFIAAAILQRPNQAVRTTEFLSLGAIGVYLLHTTLSEIIAGRSLGKWLMGLRVVALNGERATAVSLLIRNLLRIIDVGLMFAPLIVLFFSPLRQRVGDVAGGTLVVKTDAKAE